MAVKRVGIQYFDYHIKNLWARNAQGPVTMITIFFNCSTIIYLTLTPFLPVLARAKPDRSSNICIKVTES